jgi:GDP-4-dehydro-6-deoxy-D-mannose reductase
VRAFLTGGTGFVGTWLARHLEAMGDTVAILPPGLDVAEAGALDGPLREAAPDVVFHLAALTHVGRSWEAPARTFRVNALGTLEVLEAARRLASRPRVVLVSSAEVYGRGSGAPLRETAPLQPVTPYAASKVAAEFLGLQAFLGGGLDVVVARPFNHVGPGQSPDFVVSALARRVALAELSGEPEIRVGNLAAARDFTDVRDVVRAYRLLAELADPGEVYNVCSGEAVAISTVLDELIALSAAKVIPVVDPALVRPVDVPVLRGDPGRIAARCGWRPEIDRSTTLAEVLEDWRQRLAPARA